jgi:hypothetical protein
MTYAQRKLARIAALSAAGLLKRIVGYGQLGPVERLALARG